MNPGIYSAPRLLPAGGTIGLFAPSGLINQERHEKSLVHLREIGFNIVVAPESQQAWRYFAGTDESRLASFHHLLADPAIDALMMIRGGYGWSRLLNNVDWNQVATARKALIGFSDFTALNLAALAKSQLITYAGPGAAIDFGGADDGGQAAIDHAFMELHCWPVLRGETLTAGPFACDHGYAAQTIEGTLWGSNLSLVAHLVGTPYLPNIEGGIMFFEEIDEQPYAIERMFLQLLHAGVLQKQKAIILADFSDCEPESGHFEYSMVHVVDTMRSQLSIPVLTGLPFGHVARKLTIPVGATGTLEIKPDQFTLAY